MRYALINGTTNVVSNVIILVDSTQYSVPDGFYIIQNDEVNIGDIFSVETERFSQPALSSIIDISKTQFAEEEE